MTVQVIHSAQEFEEAKTSAGDKLVIVDFTAKWCGPCKMISPVFHQLATKYPNAVFLSVDTDDVPTVSRACGVRAMPTFQYYRGGQKVAEFSGADASRLEQLIVKYIGADAGASASSTSSSSAAGDANGPADLASHIDKKQSHCLNENARHAVQGLLGGTGHLESDADEQLLIDVHFNQAVRVHSIKITAKDAASAPKAIKIFVNRVEVGFDSAESQAGEHEENDLKAVTTEQTITPKYVKFQRVNSIAIFVQSNHGADVTRIAGLQFIGTPLDKVDLKDIKRVGSPHE